MNDDSTTLIDVTQVATMSWLHRATVFKLISAGKFPKPIKLGRSTRWSKGELIAWIAAKCPPLSKWEKRG
jgi:predicted DNA-binding transcriptional regulator AlpA